MSLELTIRLRRSPLLQWANSTAAFAEVNPILPSILSSDYWGTKHKMPQHGSGQEGSHRPSSPVLKRRAGALRRRLDARGAQVPSLPAGSLRGG